MTNTALRAGAQSADNTHMVFTDRKHEKFYYGQLEQAGDQRTTGQTDCHHKALIYIFIISKNTGILAEMEKERAENSIDGNEERHTLV